MRYISFVIFLTFCSWFVVLPALDNVTQADMLGGGLIVTNSAGQIKEFNAAVDISYSNNFGIGEFHSEEKNSSLLVAARQCTAGELARVQWVIEQCLKEGGSRDQCVREGMAMFEILGCSA